MPIGSRWLWNTSEGSARSRVEVVESFPLGISPFFLQFFHRLSWCNSSIPTCLRNLGTKKYELLVRDYILFMPMLVTEF